MYDEILSSSSPSRIFLRLEGGQGLWFIGHIKKTSGGHEVSDILCQDVKSYKDSEVLFMAVIYLNNADAMSCLEDITRFLQTKEDTAAFASFFAENMSHIRKIETILFDLSGLKTFEEYTQLLNLSPTFLDHVKQFWKKTFLDRYSACLADIEREKDDNKEDAAIVEELSTIKSFLQKLPAEFSIKIDEAKDYQTVVNSWPILLSPNPLELNVS